MPRAPMTDNRKGLLFLAGGVLCFAAAFGLVLFFSGRWRAGDPTTEAGSALRWIEPVPEEPAAGQNGTDSAPALSEPWVIYITGEVMAPGVYKFEPEVRVYQVVDRAGGLTPDADAVAINLARPLQDGDHIHVPSRNEVGLGAPGADPQSVIRGDETVLSKSRAVEGKIDINHCPCDSLVRLPGIGPKTAAAIIQFRQDHGSFRTVEDLIQVRGIGPAKMDQIRGLVTALP